MQAVSSASLDEARCRCGLPVRPKRGSVTRSNVGGSIRIVAAVCDRRMFETHHESALTERRYSRRQTL